jgi:hypothetical protein
MAAMVIFRNRPLTRVSTHGVSLRDLRHENKPNQPKRPVMKSATVVSIVVLTLSMCLSSAFAQGRVAVRGAHANPSGGVSAGSVVAGRTAAGGVYGRARGVSTNGAGGVSEGSVAGFKGANGSSATRTASNTSNGAGDATHQSSISATGPKGSVSSSGSATKTASGVDESRTTSATAANGDSYHGSTSYTPQTGLTHSGTCSNASGATITCPK